jgi:hypothetical protein
MGQPVSDEVDRFCDAWAYQWVSLFARDPIKASEYLGRQNCTLGSVKQMGDGAGAGTVVAQSFPEVFLGEGLIVSCLTKLMTEGEREILFRHYADRWYATRRAKGEHGTIEIVRMGRPVKQEVMAMRMSISPSLYYRRRDRMKAFIRGSICTNERRCTNEGETRHLA